MLRLYVPITHDIFKLHAMLKELVCSVWCQASSSVSCESKITGEFKLIYQKYGWLKLKVDEIYLDCIALSTVEKATIIDAFERNNQIENLCVGNISPVYLSTLPKLVEEKIKPLLVEFYEDLLEKAKVPGTKKDYYERLIESNEFKDCPCCGLVYFEQSESDNREAFDHYLPKALYPFASVNFKNLVPLCYKCNSDRKKTKDPIEGGKKAFYPFAVGLHEIKIQAKIDQTKDLRSLSRNDVDIKFTGDAEKISTWERVFEINERYNDTVRGLIFSTIRKIKRRHLYYKSSNVLWSFENTLDKLIEDYEHDKFEDKKFLKIPVMIELKGCSDLIEVYG